MAKRGPGGLKRNKRRRVPILHKGSDETDEDFTLDEEFDESEDEYRFSINGDASDESLAGFEEEEEEEVVVKMKVKKVNTAKRKKGFTKRRKNGIVKQRKRRRVSYRDEANYNFDDEDDGDAEFTFDGVDDVDDEDEIPIIRKSRNACNPPLQGRMVTRGQNTKGKRITRRKQSMKRKGNHKVVKKTIRKKPRSLRKKRKTNSNDNEELRHINSAGEQKIKITGGGGKGTSLTVDSGSDHLSSGSSDNKYTISEEEREQIREASELCRGLSSWRRSTASKNMDEPSPLLQRKRSRRKDKEKVDDIKGEAAKQVCGICLSEEGKKTVRGSLNCCSHYFCFACIMEWSKVESRCPLCKQRFSTISKPSRSDTGFNLRTVAIQVPQRDQVYQPSEEELRSYLDPYEDVICIYCGHGGDDALMLLCDLCDSPAHTYCAGLGREVPEGNWYCDTCRITALSSSNPQGLDPTPELGAVSNSVRSSPTTNLRETFDLNEMYIIPDTTLNQVPGNWSPGCSARDDQASSSASGIGVLTVSERRRIQHQINQLLNDRYRTLGPQDGLLGNSLFGSQVGRSSGMAPQLTTIPERRMHLNLQHNVQLPQHRNVLSARYDHLDGQVNDNQASFPANSTVGGLVQREFGGFNETGGSRLGHQQFHTCNSSNSDTGFDARSPHPFREANSFSIKKEEVQLRVRSQLKGLSGDFELGYDTFKAIARASTHTILAACGMENRHTEVSPVQTRLICNHNTEKQIHPGECSSCFDVFVRDVVREIVNRRAARFH